MAWSDDGTPLPQGAGSAEPKSGVPTSDEPAAVDQ